MATPPDAVSELPDLVRQLRGLVEQLEHLFPERRFTLDGHLLGSIGEVLAAQLYGLTLLPMSEPTHDAETADHTPVQIKLTQGTRVALRAEPQHLLVLRLDDDDNATEVYNGPGGPAWNACGRLQDNGQRQISLTRLRQLMMNVSVEHRIARLIP